MENRYLNLEKKDKKYLWHPFTQMKDWISSDIVIVERARGNYLYDTGGWKYLDGISSLWCNVHGHQVKEIDRAIKAQLSKVAHSTMLGLSNVPAIELAEELIRIAPKGLSRVFYSDSGSTAVEIALKMVFQYWRQAKRSTRYAKRKTKFLTFVNAYHGDTIGSVSLGGMELFHKTYQPLLFKTIKAPAPYCYRCPCGINVQPCQMECLAEVERLIKRHHKELAGVVIEPLVQGAAGMITQPKGFIRRLRQLCTKYDILMIADEVATGFGRTNLPFVQGTITEISAHSKGVYYYFPRALTIIDIGAQDNKVIHLDNNGQMINFKMNRKCAAGTGAFLEEIAYKMDIPIAELNALAKRSDNPVELGSYCTVFTATEILTRIREGKKKEDIIRGVYSSVVKRIIEMDSLQGQVAITGGVIAYNDVLVELLKNYTHNDVLVPSIPQFTGALGAALTAMGK